MGAGGQRGRRERPTVTSDGEAAKRAHPKLNDTQRIRLAFAQAVTREEPDGSQFATYYARDGGNRPDRLNPHAKLEAAVRSGRAFFVTPADEVLPADFDAKDFAGACCAGATARPCRVCVTAAVVACEDAARAFVTACEGAGQRPVLLASGSVGGFHVFVRVASSTLRAELAAEAKRLGRTGQAVRGPLGSGGIRPPLTPHRKLGYSTLLAPVGRNGKPSARLALARLLPPTKAPQRPLPAWASTLLLTGRCARREYKTRSNASMGLVMAMLLAGWSRPRIERELLNDDHQGGAHLQAVYAERGASAGIRSLDRMIKKARARIATRPTVAGDTATSDDARALVGALRELVASRSWSRQESRRAVLLAHLDVADQAGRVEGVALDERTIAERAGVTRPTATRANGWLRSHGWLRRMSKGRGTQASTWTLTLPPTRKSETSQAAPILSRLSPAPTGQSIGARRDEKRAKYLDAFTWGALPKSAGRVWEALPVEGWATARGLAEALVMRSHGVQRLLVEKLEPHGLAVRDGRRWRRGTRDLDDVAGELGTRGTTARRRDEHAADRALTRVVFRSRRGGRDPAQPSVSLSVVVREDREGSAPGALASTGPSPELRPLGDAPGPSPAKMTDTLAETPDLWQDDG